MSKASPVESLHTLFDILFVFLKFTLFKTKKVILFGFLNPVHTFLYFTLFKYLSGTTLIYFSHFFMVMSKNKLRSYKILAKDSTVKWSYFRATGYTKRWI